MIRFKDYINPPTIPGHIPNTRLGNILTFGGLGLAGISQYLISTFTSAVIGGGSVAAVGGAAPAWMPFAALGFILGAAGFVTGWAIDSVKMSRYLKDLNAGNDNISPAEFEDMKRIGKRAYYWWKEIKDPSIKNALRKKMESLNKSILAKDERRVMQEAKEISQLVKHHVQHPLLGPDE